MIVQCAMYNRVCIFQLNVSKHWAPFDVIFVWLVNYNPKKMEAFICCLWRCFWCAHYWIWDDHLIIGNYGSIYLFRRVIYDAVQNLEPNFDIGILVNVGLLPSKTEIIVWITISITMTTSVGTGCIRPGLESMRTRLIMIMIWLFSLIRLMI